jgi:hypothetical protein
VHYIGVSEWKASEIEAALEIAGQMGFDRIVSSQPQYSMLWRVIEAEVVPLCEREGVGQIVWSPIAQGVLTGKYLPGQAPPEGSRATDTSGGDKMIARWLRDDVLEKVQLLKPLAADAGLSLAQLAVAWVLQNPNVSSAIVGASRPEQVRDNVAAAGVKLEADLMARIDEVLEGVVTTDPSKTESPRPAPDGCCPRPLSCSAGRGQPHRAVHLALVLEQGDLGDAGAEQLAPVLADPGLGVGLVGVLRARRRVQRHDRLPARVLVAPGPGPSGCLRVRGQGRTGSHVRSRTCGLLGPCASDCSAPQRRGVAQPVVQLRVLPAAARAGVLRSSSARWSTTGCCSSSGRTRPAPPSAPAAGSPASRRCS